MKSHCLKHSRWVIGGWAIGLLSLCWATAPAEAGQLSTWRFDAGANRLEFNTNEDVQPRAQLVADPTRLVIDLPGTTVGQVPASQAIGQAVQQIRVTQLNSQTTRIVVQLAPGYTIDPEQVRFRGISPTQWTVQLPEPQATTAAASPASPAAQATRSSASSSSSLARSAPSAAPSVRSTPAPAANQTANQAANTPTPPADPSLTQIEGVRVTADGLFIRTSGARPEVEVKRGRRDRETITVQVDKAALSPQLTEQSIAVNQYGISTLELSQSSDRSSVEITLHVAEDSPDWQAYASGAGGIVMLPQGGINAVARLTPPAETPPETRPTQARPAEARSAETPSTEARPTQTRPTQTRPTQTRPAETPSAEARPTQTRPAETPSAEARPPAAPRSSSSASRPAPSALNSSLSSTASGEIATIAGVELNPASNQLLIRSDRPVAHSGRWQSGMYQITLSPARLADNVTGSQIGGADSPVLRVRLRQQTEETVVVSVQPAAGVRFGSLNLVSPQLLALEVQRPQPTASANTASTAPPAAAPTDRLPSVTLPNVESGRLVVVIDPGHGGSDPGAVGINGIQEKQIVLAIAQQVVAYLEQQGVQTVLTRSDDRDVELEPRVQMAEQVRASLFVSIHANAISMDRPEVNGVETYFYSSGEQMAQVIQDSLVQGTGMNDKGVRSARFYVLRRTSMPAVLIETGFVTGSEDAPRLADAGFQSQMARAIAQGILRYVQQNSAALNR